jgi:hypothetical protein
MHVDNRKAFDAIYAASNHLALFVSIGLVRVDNRLKRVPYVVIEFYYASNLISNCFPSFPKSMEIEQCCQSRANAYDSGLRSGVELFGHAKLLHGEIGQIIENTESNRE